MKRGFAPRINATLLAGSLVALLGASHPARADGAASVSPPRSDAAFATTSELAIRAMGYLGVNYRRGGNSPETGFDCSGLVRFLFSDVLGLTLPRRSEEISRIGDKIDRAALRPGDLVFYNTLRRGFSHVGIYLGEDRFIHAPSSGGEVRIEHMDDAYWRRRFNGARRLVAEVGPSAG